MTTASKFTVGTSVFVKLGPPEQHCRTPHYLRGHNGTIIADLGHFRDPASLAFHKPGLPTRRLYRVQFDQQEIWHECSSSIDKVVADIYEDWLEARPVTATTEGVHSHA